MLLCDVWQSWELGRVEKPSVNWQVNGSVVSEWFAVT